MAFFNLPRHQRTPETEIDLILSNLSALYDEDRQLCPNPGEYAFINTYFKEGYEDEHTNGDVLAMRQHCEMEKMFGESEKGTSRTSKIGAMVISCAYLCQAQRAWDAGRVNEAWTYILDAKEWSGRALQYSKRVKLLIKNDNLVRTSRTRTKIVEEDKYKKYYEKPTDFVKNMYKSRAWEGSKAQAVEVISEALENIIKEKKWPVENVYCKETGISAPKEDWYGWVDRELPSAKQIKIDAKNFLERNTAKN